ncbi:fatty acid desaturase [Silicimonas algicola]|uniref:Omega-6 fatty acid desaturase (Delta-12 desaturase) n=1 Tax=Silicimonas algicola TaxID=1826607 RepID=A0A316GDF3_9RHOB|nr:fatty acid desaturase [Silicimonas algicola]AZQ66676.1 fatty acid desaturase [Silicimonas algicola]PWK59029.1 omega-6 fatty acid desaturase (delta-12 desaturase) [Silicimonas algicola]
MTIQSAVQDGDAVMPETDARTWVRILSKYREPSHRRSAFEIAVTAVPLMALWVLAWASLSVSVWLAIGISIVNAGFLVRLFAIQHDCGHGSLFRNRRLGDWVGRVLGVVTLTPYDVWKTTHALHHASSGNLDRRGIGDVMTLTVDEYRSRSWTGRLSYRLYRNPLIMFLVGPAWLFYCQHRVPLGVGGRRVWISAMGTNIAIVCLLALVVWTVGVAPVVFLWLPTTFFAAAIGVWMFYVQHQFEDTVWQEEQDWQLHHAAAHGSSHYILPQPLQWMTANIGVHHVHHLQSRVPFYRLTEVLRDHPDLDQVQRLSVRQSLSSIKLKLWDERHQKLVSFRDARQSDVRVA